MDIYYDAITILRKFGVANFADIMKIAIMLIKTTFKDSSQ